jgi:hypothetical protein
VPIAAAEPASHADFVLDDAAPPELPNHTRGKRRETPEPPPRDTPVPPRIRTDLPVSLRAASA